MKNLTYFAIVVTLLMGFSGTALADFEPNEVLSAMDAFLIRQMEVFDSVQPPNQPPLVQTFGWNTNLQFPPYELNPPPCSSCCCAPAPLWQMAYRGDIYDQSLAACYFISRSKTDPNYLDRAKQLLDAVIFLGDHDPNADGRVRTAYWASNLLNPAGTEASIMDPSVGIGNMAYFGIALTRFYDTAENTNYLDAASRQHYLDVAKQKANWIIAHCMDHKGPGGFTGGYSGWEQTPFTWKSIEHNIDVYVFARNLHSLDHSNPKWLRMAKHAQDFVKSMYVKVDGQRGYYLTGTLDDGVTPNLSPVPADAQAWTALARRSGERIDTDKRAICAMRVLLENFKDRCESDILCVPNDGVKFSTVGKNVQCEVMASAAIALLWLDEEPSQAEEFIELLDWIRLNATPSYDGIEDGIGVVATPCPEGAWTGYGCGAWYYNLLHVASSAWTGVTVMVSQGDEMANPLVPLGVTRPGTGGPDQD